MVKSLEQIDQEFQQKYDDVRIEDGIILEKKADNIILDDLDHKDEDILSDVLTPIEFGDIISSLSDDEKEELQIEFDISGSNSVAAADEPAPAAANKVPVQGRYLTYPIHIKRISDILFYIAIFMIVFVAMTYRIGTNRAVNFFNFSFINNVDPDIEEKIPVGALVVAKTVNSDKLTIGDRIMYIQKGDAVMLGRIINIINEENNRYSFQIQSGSTNLISAQDVVWDSNVVGRVQIVIPNLGRIFHLVANNFVFVFVLFFIIISASFTLRMLYEKEKGIGYLYSGSK